VIQVSRNSLFIGGGGKVANAPMTGGAGGPARFFVDLSLADALYQPLVARQMACAAKAAQTTEFNNAQLEATLAYFDLVSAQAEVAAVGQSIKDAENLLETTRAFVDAGKAAPGELSRVEVTSANLRQDLINARLDLNLASNNLIRVVRLDTDQLVADTPLYSIETQLVPVQLVPDGADLTSLVAHGQTARPEVAQLRSIVEARLADETRERIRPYLPNVNVSASGGLFGGGTGRGLDDVGGRADIDALLVWQVRNLGFGENAARRDREAQYQQAMIRGHQMKDRIAAEVRNAWHRVVAARQRMTIAQANVETASKLLEVNLDRIQGLEGLPIEAVQALTTLAEARVTQLRTIVGYNKAQASLLRAIGRPMENAALMASGPQ